MNISAFQKLETKRITRERAIGLAVGLTVALIAFVFALRWLEAAMTFHPARIAAGATVKPPSGAEDVWFTTEDGVRLHGWFFKSARGPSATVIYFHGNGGNITNIAWVGED